MEFVIEHPIAATSWEEVRPRLQRALRDHLSPGMLEEHWEDEALRLEGLGVTASVALADGKLRALADLRPPASFFRSKIEDGLRRALERI
ncbi:MAG: hypothetical protein OES47_08470 [Acidobacteriota bacterium]|nr:hypothetical protein [Acidobacteriota bacterium]